LLWPSCPVKAVELYSKFHQVMPPFLAIATLLAVPVGKLPLRPK
jgi:hypothetical protein